jgi:hypothetical protein
VKRPGRFGKQLFLHLSVWAHVPNLPSDPHDLSTCKFQANRDAEDDL